ncbi:hypothetical protein SAY86_004462 [Trapa natans]|uniref:Uncharacterized protein n=1 Tax=Trapa natans TaxID=22666 RepID=A0AAN7MEH5_TRANT|nr:hypothetical protein SAY86_004462 [Trapa natans]
MSRCFPFLRQGYVNDGACGGEGSIESAKLQKGISKSERERIKEKNIRRKEVIQLPKKQNSGIEAKASKLVDKKSLHNEKADLLALLSDDSCPSGLSEEHNQPVPERFFYLNDATDSSKKRKQHSPIPAVRTGIKIRIPLSKTSSVPEAHIVREPACSTSCSRDEEALVQPPKKIRIRFTKRSCDREASIVNEGACSTSSSTAAVALLLPLTVPEPSPPAANIRSTRSTLAKCKEEKPPTEESLYDSLFEGFSFPPISAERNDPDDQEWLFRTKLQDNKSTVRLLDETNGDVSASSLDCSSWARARFVPDVEVFALPYTVPF